MTNLKLHTFLKHAGCPRGERGHKIRTMTDKGGGRGVKNLTFCRTSFVSSLLKTSHVTFLQVRLCARGISGAFSF